jgi:NADH dehydrogenase (ubiquinone) 1 beta subcomplex subunit 3
MSFKKKQFIHDQYLDYRSYKVDGIPELESHRSKLSNKGLRDPWIRNQVWLYDPKVGAYPQWRVGFRTAFFGFRYAMVALATCLITEKILEKAFPPFHGHIHLYNPDKPHSHSDDHHVDHDHH